MSTNPKKFVCFWGVGYDDKGTVEIVNSGHFCEGLGYNEMMIEQVMELEIHGVADLTEMWAHHVVLRVE